MIDKREYERVPFFCEATIAALPDGKPVPARSVDISLGGVAVVTQATFEPGQAVTVSFLLSVPSANKLRDQVVGRVAYLQAESDANRVGVEFSQPLDRSGNPELLRRVLKG